MSNLPMPDALGDAFVSPILQDYARASAEADRRAADLVGSTSGSRGINADGSRHRTEKRSSIAPHQPCREHPPNGIRTRAAALKGPRASAGNSGTHGKWRRVPPDGSP